jgi:hypothetical protein
MRPVWKNWLAIYCGWRERLSLCPRGKAWKLPILIVPSTITALRMSRPPSTARVDGRKGSWLWRNPALHAGRRRDVVPGLTHRACTLYPLPARVCVGWGRGPRGHDAQAPPAPSARGGIPFYIGRELLISRRRCPNGYGLWSRPALPRPISSFDNAHTVHPLLWAQLRNLGAAPLPQARENSIARALVPFRTEANQYL